MIERTQEARDLPALRILVIDDSRDAADTMTAMLRLFGYEAQAAYNARSALDHAETFHPHVFLIDLAMPQTSGLMLAKTIRAHPHHKKALLIAITGFSHHFTERESLETGFDHYLVKPVDRFLLQRILEGWGKAWPV